MGSLPMISNQVTGLGMLSSECVYVVPLIMLRPDRPGGAYEWVKKRAKATVVCFGRVMLGICEASMSFDRRGFIKQGIGAAAGAAALSLAQGGSTPEPVFADEPDRRLYPASAQQPGPNKLLLTLGTANAALLHTFTGSGAQADV